MADPMPTPRLEQVLVPVYMYHRYQTEAVSKSLGGVDYRFAVRGDGQKIFQVVPASVQRPRSWNSTRLRSSCNSTPTETRPGSPATATTSL